MGQSQVRVCAWKVLQRRATGFLDRFLFCKFIIHVRHADISASLMPQALLLTVFIFESALVSALWMYSTWLSHWRAVRKWVSWIEIMLVFPYWLMVQMCSTALTRGSSCLTKQQCISRLTEDSFLWCHHFTWRLNYASEVCWFVPTLICSPCFADLSYLQECYAIKRKMCEHRQVWVLSSCLWLIKCLALMSLS